MRRRVADLGVDDVLPAQHAVGLAPSPATFIHGVISAIEPQSKTLRAVKLLDPVAHAGIEAPGSPEKNMIAEAEVARVEALVDGDLRRGAARRTACRRSRSAASGAATGRTRALMPGAPAPNGNALAPSRSAPASAPQLPM